MVINKAKKIKLQEAYNQLLRRFDNENIKYETENNIIQPYDPNKKGPDGLPLPEPKPDTIGTGTAWIKYYNADRKHGYIFLCCHLINYETCHYDRFITVYNYGDDSIDTNMQGMSAITAIEPFPETGLLSSNTLYYKPILKELTFNDDSVLYVIPDKNTKANEEEPLNIKQVVTTTFTIYQFFADFSRDSLGNLIPLTQYNTDLVAISKLSDINTIDNADTKLFVLPIFNNNINNKKITAYKFYQTNHQNPQNKYIEVNVIKYVPNMYDDLTGLTDKNQKYHVTDSNYYTILSTVTNYTKHCDIKTFIDVTNIDPVWNFIQYRDKNLPVIPTTNYISLGKSNSYFNYSLTNSSKNTVNVSPIDYFKIATNYDALDSEVLIPNYYKSITTCSLPSLTNSEQIYKIKINSNNSHNSKNVKVTSDYNVNLNKTSNYNCKIKFKLDLETLSTNTDFDGQLDFSVQVDRYKFNSETEQYDYDKTDYLSNIINIQPTLTQITDGSFQYVWPITVENELKYYHGLNTDSNEDAILSFSILLPLDNSVYSNIFLTADITCLTNAYGVGDDIDNAYKLIPLKYDLNTLKEGIYRYYQPSYGSYVNTYLFYSYQYDNNVNKSLINMSKIDTYDLNIESKNTYYNILSKHPLKSIYKKLDTRLNYSLCPKCNGDKKLACTLCKNKRYIQDYKLNNFNIRYNCPICNPDGTKALVNDVTHRCRRCAGTGDEIKYLYYNCYEFKNLSTYTIRNTPEQTDLTVLPTVDDINALTIKISLKGETQTWPYLNYLLYKVFEINAGTALDYEKYAIFYNWIMYNLVFYKYNGTLNKYYYWNGKTHDEVLYGYNYIYSTKTYTGDEWETEKRTAHDNKVIYKVLPDIKYINDYIGFYAYNQNGTFTRIYLDDAYVYSHICETQSFKEFNMFNEEETNIIIDNHYHNNDNPDDLNFEETHIYKYFTHAPITGPNICVETLSDFI